MSYKYSKGAQVIGDLKAADDTERNTQIDFGEDYIGFETSGSLRMKISGSDGSITFNEAFTFPISDGSANQVLTTNGSGQLSWTDQSSGGGGGSGLEYATGHVDLTTNNKPVNWVNASSISAASGIKSWFIIPKNTTIDKVIVSVKGNNFSTANDGNVTLSIYKNQSDYGSTIVNQTVGADDFSEKVSNMAGGTTDCNQKVFSGLNQSVSEGDLIHIKVGKSSGSDKEALVTIVFDSGGSSSVTIPYPRLYFSGISPVSQIGNNSFTNATITTDNGKYENGFIDFGSSGNTAPARFESAIPLLGGIYTFSFWFYSKRTGSDYGAILRQESGGTPANTENYPLVTWNTSDELGVFNETSGGTFYGSGYDMTTHEGSNTWIHMAVVANGTNSKFYINGSLVGTANGVVTTSVKELGAYDGNDTQVFSEGIDDFAHWAESLSDQQISEIYNSSSKLRDIVT